MSDTDAAQFSRIPILLELMNSLRSVTDPAQLLETFSDGMRAAYGAHTFMYLATLGLPAGEYRIARLKTLDAEHVPYDHLRPEKQPVRAGGLLGDIVSANQPYLGRRLDLSADPIVGNLLADNHSLMAVPVTTTPWMTNWVLLLDNDPEAFTVHDLEELLLRVNLIGAVVNNMFVVQQLEQANRQIAREMEQIARIQRSLLPDSVPEIPGIAIATSYETFEQAGGDMYDFIPLSDGRWIILVADASGHGPAAAVVVAMVHSILHAYPRQPTGPAALLRHVNRHLCAKRVEYSFVTAFLAIYEPSTRTLLYSRAGHNAPLLRKPNEPSVLLDQVGGLPLGIDADVDFIETTLVLEPGQLLIIYTDGVIDAAPTGGEQFGITGIDQAIAFNPDKSTLDAPTAVRQIVAAIKQHEASTRPRDDQTVVAIQVLQPA